MSSSRREQLHHLIFDSSDDEDDDTVNCICKANGNTSLPMVQCTQCKDWLHTTCVSLNIDAVPRWWCCAICTQQIRDAARSPSSLSDMDGDDVLGLFVFDVVDNDTDVQMDDASETRGVETPSHRTEAGDPRSDTRRKAPGPHRSDGVMRLSRSSTPQLNNEIESTGSISGISDTLFESDDSSDASQSHFLVAKDSDTWQNSSGDHSTQVDQDLLHSDFMLIFGHQL